MKDKIFVLLILISAFSCNQNNGEKGSQKNAFLPARNDSSKSETKVVNDTMPKGLSVLSDTLVLKLAMDSANQHITVPLKIASGKELFASLSSEDKNANIRISQVGLPDSTFDGPFGRVLHYKMKTPGNYQLIIGENMMAGDRWKGDFVLRVWVR